MCGREVEMADGDNSDVSKWVHAQLVAQMSQFGVGLPFGFQLVLSRFDFALECKP